MFHSRYIFPSYSKAELDSPAVLIDLGRGGEATRVFNRFNKLKAQRLFPTNCEFLDWLLEAHINRGGEVIPRKTASIKHEDTCTAAPTDELDPNTEDGECSHANESASPESLSLQHTHIGPKRMPCLIPDTSECHINSDDKAVQDSKSSNEETDEKGKIDEYSYHPKDVAEAKQPETFGMKRIPCLTIADASFHESPSKGGRSSGDKSHVPKQMPCLTPHNVILDEAASKEREFETERMPCLTAASKGGKHKSVIASKGGQSSGDKAVVESNSEDMSLSPNNNSSSFNMNRSTSVISNIQDPSSLSNVLTRTKSIQRRKLQCPNKISLATVASSEVYYCEPCGQLFTEKQSFTEHKLICIERQQKHEPKQSPPVDEQPAATRETKRTSFLKHHNTKKAYTFIKDSQMSPVSYQSDDKPDLPADQPTSISEARSLPEGIRDSSEAQDEIVIDCVFEGEASVDGDASDMDDTTSGEDNKPQQTSQQTSITIKMLLESHQSDEDDDDRDLQSDEANQDKLWKCERCGKLHHGIHNQPSVGCPTCGKMSQTTSEEDGKPPQASHQPSISIKTLLENHESDEDEHGGDPQSDEADKLWKCERCGKLFQYQSSLRKHVLLSLQENGPGECAICKAPFCLANDLKLHLIQHTRSGAILSFNCEMCNKVFKHPRSLAKHKYLSTQELGNKGFLTCDFCSLSFCLSNDLQRHLAYHNSERENGAWNCDKCDKVFKSRAVLANHIYLSSAENETHLPGDRPAQQCATCTKRFCLEKDLQRHILIHDTITTFACDICSKNFRSKRNLVEHLGTHNRPSVGCPTCGKMFKTQKCLRRHSSTHNTERKFTCDICNKSFRTLVVLNGHKGTHSKPHVCELCGKTCSTVTLLKSHQIYMHGRAAPFTCAVCGKGAPSQMQLDTHLRTHTGERPYECDVPGCGKAFTAKKNLKDHKQCVHRIDANHSCTLCEMAFSSEKKLNIHLQKHMGIKPFECEYCGRRFAQKGGLVSHRRVHTGEKPYECEVCKKAFKNSGNLKIHLRTHSGERPYECAVCHKRSSCFANFKKHWKVHPPATMVGKK